MHNIEYGIYKENVNKKNVQQYWDEYAAHEDWQEGCSGLSQDIRWIDHICEDRDAAYGYIEAHDKGWYDQLAVKFKEYPPIKETKSLAIIKTRLEETTKKYNTLEATIHYVNTKAALITCKCCGSKIAKAYIKSNYCPVCKGDLRPATTLETLKKYKEKISKLTKELKEEEKKLQKKMEKHAAIKWLVKIEYHT